MSKAGINYKCGETFLALGVCNLKTVQANIFKVQGLKISFQVLKKIFVNEIRSTAKEEISHFEEGCGLKPKGVR